MAVDPVARIYGVVIRHLREDSGLSLSKAVRGRGLDGSYLSKIETGNRFPSAQVAETLDEMFDSDLPSTLRAEFEQLKIPVAAADDRPLGPSMEMIMDETRRRLMLSLGLLGAGAATVPAAVLTPIRQALAGALPDAAYDHSVDDWEEIAGEHAHAYLTMAPMQRLPDLAADIITLQHLIRSTRDDNTKRALYRPGALLAALMAKTLSSCGQQREARHWWQTARHTADASGDTELSTVVRGEEAIRGLYEHRPPHTLEQRVGEALSLGKGLPYGGVATALAARAQMFAVMGRATEAVAVLRQVESMYERLPDSVTTDTSSFGWPPQDLHHTASFVHTRLGNLPEATRAQDHALELYPAPLFLERAKIELHRADCLVRAGDVTDGIGHATAVLDRIPEDRRTVVLRDVAVAVIESVPVSERDRAPVRDYQELLA
ncbi:MAG TPA: helix-turn-helix transcriptional regulator [Streptosporangiaceae bacterium]|nr:helix-turn-helix transcriptional regulator [Streptosporangiaceae bacterium]